MTTYWEYLKLDKLLALQNGLDEDESRILPGELHFILVHQVFELWFKLILRELRMARDELMALGASRERVPAVVHSLDRANKTISAAVQQWEVMETLPPQDFLDFRDKLFPASGFQSFQFPEIEIVMGLEESLLATSGSVRSLDHIRNMADQCEAGARAWRRIERARSEKTLRSALYDWLYAGPIAHSRPEDPDDKAVVREFLYLYLSATREYHRKQIEQLLAAPGTSREAVEARFAESYREAEEFALALDTPEAARQRQQRVRASLLYIETYSDLTELAWPRMLVNAFLDLEASMVLWRTRHARMAERVIGRRVGTGGASADYLGQTAGLRVYTDLWAARSQILPRNLAPKIEAGVSRAAWSMALA